MKKVILLIAICISFTIPLTAFSWAGYIDAGAELSGPPTAFNTLTLNHTDRATIQFQIPFNTANEMSISFQGFYEFGLSKSLEGDSESILSHTVDLESFKFNMQLPLGDTSYFSLNAGRFFISDITGITVSQVADGASLTYTGETMQLSSYVGFTGLLNAYTVSINATPNGNILSDIYTLAPPFILANIALQMPQLFAGQDLFAEVFTTIDVSTQENPDHRIYSALGLSGPLGNSLFYTLSSSLGITQPTASTWEFSNLSQLELSAFLPFASSLVSWKTIFATGGADQNYIPFTLNTATVDDSLAYSGHIKTGLVTTFRPLSNMLLLLGSDVLFNVMNEDATTGYSGVQWLVATRWGIASDLQLLVSAEQFIPEEDPTDSYLNASLKLVFNF